VDFYSHFSNSTDSCTIIQLILEIESRVIKTVANRDRFLESDLAAQVNCLARKSDGKRKWQKTAVDSCLMELFAMPLSHQGQRQWRLSRARTNPSKPE
jgi:hypothetical protein